MTPQADGSLLLVPTRHDFWQRVSGMVLLVAFGGLILGFMLLLEFKAPGPSPENAKQALIALRVFQCVGAIIILWGVHMFLAWFLKRQTLSLDPRRNLVFTSRIWFSRREVYPLTSIQSIEYGARKHVIARLRRPGVRIGSEVVGVFWIWSVTLLIKPGPYDYEPYKERFDLVAKDAPPQPGDRLPDEVIALGTWLHQATGMTITAAETETPSG